MHTRTQLTDTGSVRRPNARQSVSRTLRTPAGIGRTGIGVVRYKSARCLRTGHMRSHGPPGWGYTHATYAIAPHGGTHTHTVAHLLVAATSVTATTTTTTTTNEVYTQVKVLLSWRHAAAATATVLFERRRGGGGTTCGRPEWRRRRCRLWTADSSFGIARWYIPENIRTGGDFSCLVRYQTKSGVRLYDLYDHL